LDLSLDIMKKLYTYYIFLLLLFGNFHLFTGCKSTETNLKTEDTQAFTELETLLKQKEYRIDIHTISPFNTAATTQVLNALVFQNTGNTANRINVRGDGNFIELQDSIATCYLPFFGEQQMSTGNYGGTDSAIQFGGMLKDYRVERYKKKDGFVIEFTTNQKNHTTESFNVSIIVFLNRSAAITLLSSHRNFIRYQGQLTFIEKLEE